MRQTEHKAGQVAGKQQSGRTCEQATTEKDKQEGRQRHMQGGKGAGRSAGVRHATVIRQHVQLQAVLEI